MSDATVPMVTVQGRITFYSKALIMDEVTVAMVNVQGIIILYDNL